MHKFIPTSVIALLLSLPALWAQDPMFSQFYAAPLQLNPAFAGVTNAPRLSLNYRNQWAQISGGYQTYAAAYEQSIESLNSGIGMIIMADDAMNGVYQTTRVSGVYGYRLQISQTAFIKFGVEAGFIRSSLDWNRLQFGDQIDPIDGFTEPQSAERRPENLNTITPDISAGLLIYNDKFYGGIAVKHLNNPDDSFFPVNENIGAGIPVHISVQAGAEFDLGGGNNQNGSAFISPNVLIARQADFVQANVGAYAGSGKFFGGLWYRHTLSNADAAIILAGFREGALRVGYSYDFTLSQLANVNPGGTHEISIAINFDDSREARRRSRSNYNDCFKMFK
ncbi:MAG TPA: type IX secretion system membrane protein PorP/SprF [Saprospiraceae bacterium]|nr:type IX secretion system membrane protein PorP/SprF [Saprospiraceae bacterium]HMP25938.1 type IX secretion system membrane protein PorP/SprF [Saprospiraceae bacterium]